MKRGFLILFIFVCFLGYGQTNEDKWVLVEFSVPKSDAKEMHYFYGQIEAKIYRSIVNGTYDNLFFVLRNVRYFDDVYKKFEDEEDTGVLIYKTEFINRIIPQKQDPLTLNNKKKKYPKAASSKNLAQE